MQKNRLHKLIQISCPFSFLLVLAIIFASCDRPGLLLQELGYSSDAIALIVNADDVGVHPDVTDATIQAMREGLVTSASVMVPCPDFERTMRIWRDNPDLDFGIHLTLTCEWGHRYPWSPLLPKEQAPSLYTEDGFMWPDVGSLVRHAKPEEIILEAEAQILEVLSFGVRPTHLDAHMSWYMADTDYFERVMELAKKYRLPMRVWRRIRTRLPWWPNDPAEMRRKGFVFPNSQESYYNIEGENGQDGLWQAKYTRFLRGLRAGVHEITLHLAFPTDSLKAFMESEDVERRKHDYLIWTSQTTRSIILERKIMLLSFRELQRLQEARWPRPMASFTYDGRPQWALSQERN